MYFKNAYAAGIYILLDVQSASNYRDCHFLMCGYVTEGYRHKRLLFCAIKVAILRCY